LSETGSKKLPGISARRSSVQDEISVHEELKVEPTRNFKSRRFTGDPEPARLSDFC